jgi:DNA-binding transcriptional ArsR family regulator
VATYQSALTALADPTRRNVFERLVEGPRSVADLAEDFPVSRPAVSQHLRVLKEAGLVVDRRAGARRVYHLNPDGLAALRDYLDRFWDQALVAFKAVAESQPDDERTMTKEPNDERTMTKEPDGEKGEGKWR